MIKQTLCVIYFLLLMLVNTQYLQSNTLTIQNLQNIHMQVQKKRSVYILKLQFANQLIFFAHLNHDMARLNQQKVLQKLIYPKIDRAIAIQRLTNQQKKEKLSQKQQQSQKLSAQHSHYETNVIKRCGYTNQQVKIYNGTYETIKLYSNLPFSAITQRDGTFIKITGMGISNQVSEQKIKNSAYLRQIMNTFKLYNSHMKKLSQLLSSKLYQTQVQTYVQCKTENFLTKKQPVVIQITYQDYKKEALDEYNMQMQDYSLEQFDKILQQIQKHQIKLDIRIICTDSDYLKYVNLVFSKIYLFGVFLMLQFSFIIKPYIKWHYAVRIILFILYLYILSYTQQWTEICLIMNLAISIIAVLVYLTNKCYPTIDRIKQIHHLLVMASPILLYLLFNLPKLLFAYSETFTIFMYNVFIILAITILVSSFILLQRLRHVFYYIFVIGICEIYLSQFTFFENFFDSLAFKVLSIQVFPDKCNAQSIFYILMYLPVYDYFFENKKSDRVYKYIIMILSSILNTYFSISITVLTVIAIITWIIKQSSTKKRNIIQIIKYQRKIQFLILI